MGTAQLHPTMSPHIPVLLNQILASAKPISGVWIDGTFGAGGYSRAILDAGADTLYAIDRDPEVFTRSEKWIKDYDGRLKLIQGTFGELDTHVKNEGANLIDGVVLDIGVSSMQLDQADRGFSFMKDGPLDMRMGQSGMSAADIVNSVAYSQTAVPSIFAVGDITDRANLTPVAIREGMAFVETVFKGKPTKPDHDLIPTAIFTQPEMGTIGLSEEEAKAQGPIEVYATWPFPHGEDRFGVVFEMDAEPKGGSRFKMKEIAIYTVADGKITREEFFYSE